MQLGGLEEPRVSRPAAAVSLLLPAGGGRRLEGGPHAVEAVLGEGLVAERRGLRLGCERFERSEGLNHSNFSDQSSVKILSE